MQKLINLNYEPSEQHNDLTKSMQVKDMADTCEMMEFLKPYQWQL
jgi:hypothetical protein